MAAIRASWWSSAKTSPWPGSTQALSKVTLTRAGAAPQTGVGAFEQLIFGPYPPYGLK